MGSALRLPDGRRIEVVTDMIDVTSSLPRPDEKWTYTDRAGHEHHWSDDAWPTLRQVIDDVYWVLDDDGYEEYKEEEFHWECVQCGEHIEPGMRGPSMFKEYMPGHTSYFLDGEEITHEQAEVLLNPEATDQ